MDATIDWCDESTKRDVVRDPSNLAVTSLPPCVAGSPRHFGQVAVSVLALKLSRCWTIESLKRSCGPL